MANLGYEVCDQTVGNVLQRHALPAAPERKRTTTWPAFIRTHQALLAGTDFFTVEVLTARASGGSAPPAVGPEAPVVAAIDFSRKALQVMGLEDSATVAEIKVRFKALVKQHHPDANGGDRSTEDRLIEIIKAYNYLKSIAKG